jgi:adenylate kinase family enzyme
MKTIEQVLQIDIENKNVLIIGCPASGKTYLSKKFKHEHKIIHTDDYIKFGYEQSMYQVLEDIKKSDKCTLVEGIQGYRLLRKGVQLDCYYPHIVIELMISEQHMIHIYKKERDEKKIKFLKGFNKMHDKIINDYFLLKNKNKPEWIKVFNDY